MKTLLLTFATLLCPMVYGQALPDAPEPQPKPASFFTFRKSWQDPPLRTNKQFFKSKTFWLSQAGAAAALVIACRNPRSHEHWDSELPAFAGVFGMSYLGGRFFTQSFAVGPGVYEIVHYSVAAAK
jgi:hypothetical protein